MATVAELWAAAKQEKVAGNNLPWNTLGSMQDPGRELTKILEAWHGRVGTGTLITKPDFPMDAFDPPPELLKWMSEDSGSKALIVEGDAGLGKTEMCIAALHQLAGSVHFLSKLDQLKKIHIAAGQALLVDDLSLAATTADDTKAWLDVRKPRDVSNRHLDGHIPAQTIRAFCTNHSRATFFCTEYHSNPVPKKAIDRRHTWITVDRDVRRLTGSQVQIRKNMYSEALVKPPATVQSSKKWCITFLTRSGCLYLLSCFLQQSSMQIRQY